jgi:hypothetical protein
MKKACRAEAPCQIVRIEGWRAKDGLSIEVPLNLDESDSKTRSPSFFSGSEF